MSTPSLPVTQGPAVTAAANTYTDLKGLAAIKKDANSPQAVHALAQQVDALFLQMMLKSMREAGAEEEGEPDSNAMGMYKDLYDKQISLTLSEHGGLGIGALLTRQMAIAANAAAGGAGGAAAAGGGSGAGKSGVGSGAVVPAGSTVPAAGAAASADAARPAQSLPPVPPSALPAAVAPITDNRHGPQTSIGLADSASQFVNAVLPTIRAAAAALGVNPLGLLAQAALETGWGKRMARTVEGAPSLNMFGIKADDRWGGARATANTVEFSGGIATKRQTAFRAYASIADSVSDFAHLLGNSPRYRQVLAAGGNAQAYVNSIGRSGYATDPEYGNKLNEILNGSTLRAALGGSIPL